MNNLEMTTFTLAISTLIFMPYLIEHIKHHRSNLGFFGQRDVASDTWHLWSDEKNQRKHVGCKCKAGVGSNLVFHFKLTELKKCEIERDIESFKELTKGRHSIVQEKA